MVLTEVDEKLKSISNKSLPGISNQSFETDKVVPTPENTTAAKFQNSFGGKGSLG